MSKFIVTFGQVHIHRINDSIFDKDCVAVIEATDYNEARKKTFKLFGNKWCMLYETELFDSKSLLGYYPRGAIQIP